MKTITVQAVQYRVVYFIFRPRLREGFFSVSHVYRRKGAQISIPNLIKLRQRERERERERERQRERERETETERERERERETETERERERERQRQRQRERDREPPSWQHVNLESLMAA